MSEIVKDCRIGDLFSLQDRVVLVVGAGGLGAYIGRGMAINGAKVIFTNTSIGKAQKVQSDLAAEGLSCDIYQLDVTNNDQVVEVVQAIAEKYGRIDVLITPLESAPTPSRRIIRPRWSARWWMSTLTAPSSSAGRLVKS